MPPPLDALLPSKVQSVRVTSASMSQRPPPAPEKGFSAPSYWALLWVKVQPVSVAVPSLMKRPPPSPPPLTLFVGEGAARQRCRARLL